MDPSFGGNLLRVGEEGGDNSTPGFFADCRGRGVFAVIGENGEAAGSGYSEPGA